jgi:hypothetical protein
VEGPDHRLFLPFRRHLLGRAELLAVRLSQRRW